MATPKRNPREVAVASLDSMADALLRKRLRALKAKSGGKEDAPGADDFSPEDLEALTAALEE